MTAPRSLNSGFRDSSRLRDIPAVSPIRERSTVWTEAYYRNRWWIAAGIALTAATCIAWGLS